MTKPEPPPSYMPANMRKERETHKLVVGEMKLVPQPVKPVDIDYSTLVQYHGK